MKEQSKIQVKDNEQATATFIHIHTGKPAKYIIMRNPLTGRWLQKHTIGDHTNDYYSDKNEAIGLLNSIVQKCKEAGLNCEVKIQPRKVMPD